MAFPQVAATNSGNSGANATSHVINMPAGVAVGNLVIVCFCSDNDLTTVSVSSGTGWAQLFTAARSGSCRVSVYWKVADGSGDNLTIDTSASEGSAHTSYRITGFDSGTAPEAGTAANDFGTTPDPPTLNPAGWDIEDTLWIAIYGWDTGDRVHDAYPANYTGNQVTNRWNSTDGVGIAVSTRELNAASDDPGTGSMTTNVTWVANTIAVRPAAAVTGQPTRRRWNQIPHMGGNKRFTQVGSW